MRLKKSSPPRSVSVGAGLGVGLLGALALALRFSRHHQLRRQIPDAISPAVFATRVLNTSAGEIVYHTSGTGEPLLFLHGIFPGASSFEWSKIYPHFAQEYHVLVPDLIGFGESQRPRPTVSVEAHLRALTQFLNSTAGGRPATIIASGLSANLALAFAARFPQYVARLFLWMPLLTMHKKNSAGAYHDFSWFPALARIVYRRQLSTEANIKQWLLRSGFADDAVSLEEALTVLSSTAQQYGAEHAFLAQNGRRFWKIIPKLMAPIQVPIALLVTQDSERQTTEAITHLRPYSTRFSLHEVETKNLLAPLSDPQLLINALECELKKI